MKICSVSFDGSRSDNHKRKLSNPVRTLALATVLVPAVSSASYNININDQVRRDYFVRNFIQRNGMMQGSMTDVDKELLMTDVPQSKREVFDFNGDGKIDKAEKMSYGEYLELKKFDKNNDGIIDCSAKPRVIYVCGAEIYTHKGKKEVMHVMRSHQDDSHEVMAEDLAELTKFMTEKERSRHLKQIRFNALMDGEISGSESLYQVIEKTDDKTLITYLQDRINNPNFDRERSILADGSQPLELLKRLIKYNKDNLPEGITRNDEWFDNITAKLRLFPEPDPENKNQFNMAKYKERNLVPVMMYIRKNNPELRQKLLNQLMLRSKDFKTRNVNLASLCLHHPYAAVILLTPDKPVD